MRESIERRESTGTDASPHDKRRVHVGTVHFASRLPSRGSLVALAVAVLVAGGVLLALGLLLLAAMATAGAVIGAGYVLYRKARRAIVGPGDEPSAARLDPAMEVAALDEPESAAPRLRDGGRRE